MKISILFLLLSVVGSLASPERPTRRFFPRQRQNEVAPPLEEAPGKDIIEEPVTPRFRIGGVPRKNLASKKPQKAAEVEDQSATAPRFRIGGRPSGSSFTPRQSFTSQSTVEEPSFAGRPLEAVAEIPTPPALSRTPAAEKPLAPVARAPSAGPRTRGSTTFIESLKQGTIPVEPSQIEELERLQTAGGKAPSRDPNRSTSSPRPTSRVSSRRSFAKPNTAASTQTLIEDISVSPEKTRPTSSSGNDDKSTRRQRLLQLKRRPRIGGAAAETTPEEPIMVDEERTKEIPEKLLLPETDKLGDNQITIPIQEEVSGNGDIESNAVEVQRVAETQRDEAMPKPKEGSVDVMKNIDPSEKIIEDELLSLDAQDAPTATEEPIPVTTLAAPKRRVSTLARLRNSRPSPSSESRPRPESGVSRQPARDKSQFATSDNIPAAGRLSSRRGGRGNSRGGAAVAAAAAEQTAGSRVASARTGGARVSSNGVASIRINGLRARGTSSRGRSPPPAETEDAATEESARLATPRLQRG